MWLILPLQMSSPANYNGHVSPVLPGYFKKNGGLRTILKQRDFELKN